MLSLVADYDTTSSSSSSDEEQIQNEAKPENIDKKQSLSTDEPKLLPSANLLLSGALNKTTGDVFSNPFLEAEKLEIDKLQKHVKMVDAENHLVQKNGRKICWNNKKGRCRFGNKCKYAHDSDLVEPTTNDDTNKVNTVNKVLTTPATTKSLSQPLYTSDDHSRDPIDLSDSSDKIKSRKRPGLGDSIVPGKRVMKTYQNSKKSS